LLFSSFADKDGNNKVTFLGKTLSDIKGGKLFTNDKKALSEYIKALQSGQSQQEAFDSTMSGASEKAQIFAKSIDTSSESLQKYSTEVQNISAGSKLLKVGLAALNSIAVSLLASFAQWAISKVIDNVVNRVENAYNKAKKIADETATTATKSTEDSKTLDELINKYKELRSSENYGASERSQVATIQQQIVSLVGEEAAGLDLVNGNLETQLGILKQISAEKLQNAIRDQKIATDAAIEAANATPSLNKTLMAHNAYKGNRNDEAAAALTKHGIYNVGGPFSFVNDFINGFRIDDGTDNGATLMTRLNFLKRVRSALESEITDFQSNDVWVGVSKQISAYDAELSKVTTEVNKQMQLLTMEAMQSNGDLESIAKDTADGFEQYVDIIVSQVSKSGWFDDYIDQGFIDLDSIRDYVITQLSSIEDFSAGRDKWNKENRKNDILDSIFGAGSLGRAKSQTVGEISKFIDSLPDEDLEIAYTVALDKQSEIETVDQFKELIDKAKEDALNADSISFNEFVSSDTIKNDLEPILKEYQEIAAARKKLQSGEATESDLIYEHPSWAKYAGNLEAGLIDHAEELKKKAETEIGKIVITPEIDEDGTDNIAAFETWRDSFLKQFEEEGVITLPIDIDAETTGMNNVMSAIKSSVSETGLAADQVEKLKERYKGLTDAGDSLNNLFDRTTSGIHLNTDALRELEDAYQKQLTDKVSVDLEKQRRLYQELTESINNAGDADTSGLEAQRAAAANAIRELESLSAQLAGVTSKYNKWKQARSGGEEGDAYVDTTSQLKDLQEQRKKGLVGTNEFRSAVEFMAGGVEDVDLSTASVDQLVAAYDKAYPKMQRYFTESNKGTQNFLKDLEKAGKASKDAEGVWSFDFGEDGMQGVVDDLGISAEAIYQILGRLKDYGAEVHLESLFPDIDLQADNIADAITEVDEKIQQVKQDIADGKVSEEAGNEQIEKYNEAKEALQNMDVGAEVNTLSLDEALAKIQELEGAITTLTSAGIEIPVSIAGQYDELQTFVQEYSEKKNIDVEVKVNVSGDAQEKIEAISKSIDDLGKKKTTLEINATDKVSTVVDGAKEKLDNTAEGLYNATVSAQTDSTVAAVAKALDEAAEDRTATITTKYVEAPVTGDEPDYVDNTHINEDGVTVGYSGVLPYKTREPDKGKDAEIVPIEQTWQNSPAPKNLDVEVEASEDSGEKIVEQVQDDIDEQPPIEEKIINNSDGMIMFPGDEGYDIDVDVNASDPSKPIEQVKEAASSNPIEIELTKNDTNDAVEAANSLIGKADELGVGDMEGGPELISNLTTAYNELYQAEVKAAEVAKTGDSSGATEAASELQSAAQSYMDAYNSLSDVLSSGIEPLEVDADTETVLSKIQALADIDPTLVVGVNDVAVKAYQSENIDKDAKVNYALGKTPDYNPQDIDRNLTYHIKTVGSVSGGAGATGTAHARGTAFKSGRWGVRGEGDALGGETGEELVVRDGRFFTIGTNGAEFFHYKDGDIIFNASQTKELLERGKIISGKSRGRVFGSGSAYAEGLAFDEPSIYGSTKDYSDNSGSSSGKKTSKKSSSKKSSKSSSKKKSSKSSKDSNDMMDWIEVAIDRVELAIKKLARVADSTFKGLATRLSATNDEIGEISKKISIEQQGYDRYMQQANSVKLTDATKQKIMDGTIDITQYSDSQKKRIDEFKKWYDKAQDCADAVEELNENLATLYNNKFGAISKDADNQIKLLEHLTNSFNDGLDLIEERGYKGGATLYASMQNVERQNIAVFQKELADLTQVMNEAVNSGKIQEGSEAWYDMQQQINSVKESIQESETAIVKYGNAIRQVKWDLFDYTQDRIATLTSEAQFMFDLMERSKLYDDNGNFTSTGKVQVGMTAQNYNVYMAQADMYGDEVKNITAELANDPNNTKLIDRREELLKLQQESISSAEDEKRAMADLVEEGINAQLDALKDLIDAYEESLSNAKDLYDYQKKVKNQTKEIASIQKQLSAYQGDTSEENQARLQKLKVDLSDAVEDLQDTQYDQYIKDQKKLLDGLYSDYEELLNNRLDDIDALMLEMIDYANANAVEIGQTIYDEAAQVGYTITDNMNEIWNSYNTDNVLEKYGESILGQFGSVTNVINGIVNQVAAINNAANAIAAQVQAKVAASAAASTGGSAAAIVSSPSVAAAASGGQKVTVANGQWWLYKNGPKSGQTSDIVHTGEKYEYLGEDKASNGEKYTKISYKGKVRWFNSKGKGKLGYSQGGFIADLQKIAYQNGDDMLTFNTLKRGEAVLTPEQSIQFKNLTDHLPQLQGIIDMSGHMQQIRSGSNASSGEIRIDVGGITTTVENVQDYNDFLRQMRDDKNFERMIDAMTLDRLVGKSSLAKKKYFS